MKRVKWFSVGIASMMLVAGMAWAHHGSGGGLATLQNVLVTVGGVDGRALGRNNVGPLCVAAIESELREEGFTVVNTREHADGELILAGGYITVTQGSSSSIGDVVLSYAVEVRDIVTGRNMFSYIEDEDADTASEACTDAAEDIVEELKEARNRAHHGDDDDDG